MTVRQADGHSETRASLSFYGTLKIQLNVVNKEMTRIELIIFKYM